MTGYSTVLTALNNFGGRQQLPILRFHFSLISPLLRHICIDISDSIDRVPPLTIYLQFFVSLTNFKFTCISKIHRKFEVYNYTFSKKLSWTFPSN